MPLTAAQRTAIEEMVESQMQPMRHRLYLIMAAMAISVVIGATLGVYLVKTQNTSQSQKNCQTINYGRTHNGLALANAQIGLVKEIVFLSQRGRDVSDEEKAIGQEFIDHQYKLLKGPLHPTLLDCGDS